jgi:hypothetical protein
MRSCVAAAVCGRALSWSITTPRLSMPRHLFHFVFIRKHLRHPAWTQFPKTNFIRHNFVKNWPWNLWKMQGKWRNGKSSVLLKLLFHCTHQIFINHKWSAAPRMIVHVFAYFVKVSHPSSYHWITYGMFSIHFTVDDECQPVSCFLDSRNGLQTSFHMSRVSRFSWTF